MVFLSSTPLVDREPVSWHIFVVICYSSQFHRVLISDDKSTFWHCTRHMSNTNVARFLVFGVSDTLAGFPSHHLKHAESPHCWGKSCHGQYSMLRSVNEIVCCFIFRLTLTVSSQFLKIFLMLFLERFLPWYHIPVDVWWAPRCRLSCRILTNELCKD
jgi:hypothetical protein